MRHCARVWNYDDVLCRVFALASVVFILSVGQVQAQVRQRASLDALRAKMPEVFADFRITADVVYKTVGGRDLQLDLLIPQGSA